MKCLITCGPSYEPMDQVRRLTNFSTGRLGIELANFLVDQGHTASVLQGYYSTYREPCRAHEVTVFTTGGSLLTRLKDVSAQHFDAVFHAAAISDFEFGKVYRRLKNGSLEAITSGKFTTREGTLLAELEPTPKLLPELPQMFPAARIFGWKFEVEGDRESAVALGVKQVRDWKTHFCVVNGPAYGTGYGLVDGDKTLVDCPTPDELYARLLEAATAPRD